LMPGALTRPDASRGRRNKPISRGRTMARTKFRTKACLLAAVSAAALLPGLALAQNAQVAAISTAVETVVVSGSLISRPGFSAPTPVSVVNSADLLRQAP